MNLKIVACKSMFRELNYFALNSTNVTDITWLSWGLHDVVGGLAVALQAELDAIDSGKDVRTTYPPFGAPFDAILLGYGLCSNGVVGLSSATTPLVIPRGHDCITHFLGSKERYKELFDQNGGTYWFSCGWIEQSPMPGKKRHDAMVKMYTERYDDPERAEELTALYEQSWQDNYSRLGKVNWKEFEGQEFARNCAEFARTCAAELGWKLEEFDGDSSLMRDFIAGNWDDDRFLIVPPGKKVKASFDAQIISYE